MVERLRAAATEGRLTLDERPTPTTESAPLVRVRAYSLFGNVKVWSP